MGRKNARKRERRAVQRARRDRWETAGVLELEAPGAFLGEDEMVTLWQERAREASAVAVTRMCAGCREFVEDGEGGRGTCLHPASGVLAPWTDTPACAFWSRR